MSTLVIDSCFCDWIFVIFIELNGCPYRNFGEVFSLEFIYHTYAYHIIIHSYHPYSYHDTNSNTRYKSYPVFRQNIIYIKYLIHLLYNIIAKFAFIKNIIKLGINIKRVKNNKLDNRTNRVYKNYKKCQPYTTNKQHPNTWTSVRKWWTIWKLTASSFITRHRTWVYRTAKIWI